MRWLRRDIVFRVSLALGLALIGAAGVVTWLRWPQSVDRGTIPGTVAAPGRTAEAPEVEASANPRATQGRISPGQQRPISLHIPSLGIDAPIVPVTVGADGALGVPRDPSRVGWWSRGPAPGASQGTAVIDGHVDWGVPGALFHLKDLEVGAKVIVDEVGGPSEFRVVALREYAKATLPWRQIFDQSVPSRLVIVTCGGSFNAQTGHYLDNIVAYAVPVTT